MTMYKPISKSNLSSQIAECIENLILDQKLKVGDKLPSEMELAEQFHTSRNIVREAISMLKERGLVEVRNGSGAYVVRPEPSTLGSVMKRLVTVGATDAYEIYEIRMALEVRACGMAAVNAEAGEVEILKQLIAKMEQNYSDNIMWSKYDYQFHEKLAEMTHSTLFPVFLRPLISMVYDLSDQQPRTTKARKNGIEQHKKIVEAVEKGDRQEAEGAMERHLQIFLDDLLKEKEEGLT
ncbi:MAG: FadR/GntR family transcriptional regulator [Eubacteriales bacterium]|nr:FadR/GntR family transcriptional regulator [Eubacteriales bacterium]